MMTSIVEEVKTSNTTRTEMRSEILIPANTLVIGKKTATQYLPPAIFRISTTGELIIRARGSLSIVTAVDVAEIVKRNVGELDTRSIKLGTDEFVVDGFSKRMSFIEIYLARKIAIQSQPTVVEVEKKAVKKAKVARKATAKKVVRKKKSMA